MPSLRESQAALAADLLAAEAPDHADYVADARPGGPARLNIYRNNVRAGFQGALEAAYPVVRQLIGDDYFRLLARRYLHARPARGGAMAGYGEGFADLLPTQPELASLPRIAEVARFEWARQRCWLATDAPALATAELAAVPMERIPALLFRVAASVGRLDSGWPVDALWEAHRSTPIGSVNLRTRPVSLLLHRAADGIVCRRLAAGERAFLDALIAGSPFEAPCLPADAADPAGADPVAWLPALVAGGIITDFEDRAAPRP